MTIMILLQCLRAGNGLGKCGSHYKRGSHVRLHAFNTLITFIDLLMLLFRHSVKVHGRF